MTCLFGILSGFLLLVSIYVLKAVLSIYLVDLAVQLILLCFNCQGGFVALTERQGAVRDSRSFRTHFMKSPIAFSQRIVDENSAVNKKSVGLWASTASLKDLMLQPKAETKSSE